MSIFVFGVFVGGFEFPDFEDGICGWGFGFADHESEVIDSGVAGIDVFICGDGVTWENLSNFHDFGVVSALMCP